MEEYFPPIGTDHQILDGRKARPRPMVFVISGICILVFFFILFCWWKQRTHIFTVPNEVITIDYSSDAAHFLEKEQRIFLPNEWRSSTASGLLPRIIGGTEKKPTWLLAPIWTQSPEGWQEQERFGLYRVTKSKTASDATKSLRLRDRSLWSLGINNVILRGELRLYSSSTIFALNKHLLVTSLPASQPNIEPLPGYDASYVLQHSSLDAALLGRITLLDQGLAPWRYDISRIAWNAPTGTLTDWAVELQTASSSLRQILAATSTRLETALLPDGSMSLRYHAPSSSAGLLLQNGVPSDARTPRCVDPDFHPFFHLSEKSLAHAWSRIGSVRPNTLQIGELAGQLALCLPDSPSVDK